MSAPAERVPAGQIHDLGYKRYAGTRRAPSTRWRSIARNQIALAWKGWWRFKAVLGFAVIVMCIAAGLMVFASDNMSSLGRAQPLAMRFIDSVLPESIIWFCRVGFVLTLTIGATVVASDVQSGAFTFYFARSVRPRHYVIGKLVGLCALLAFLVAAGPLVVTALRLGISESTGELVHLLPLIPKTLAIGAIATLVYAAVPLGFSALLASRRNALAMWASYYLVFGGLAWIVGKAGSGAVAALDLAQSIKAVAYWLYGVQYRPRDPQIPIEAAIASLSIHVVASIAIVAYQVRRAHLSGVGGSS